jgi:hypothetical protein
MDDPKEFARVPARALRNDGGGSGAPPAAPPQTSTGGPDEDRPWWEKWILGINDRLSAHDEALASADQIFECYEQRVIALEARLAALEKKPAARAVEHVRDSHGAVIRSVIVDAAG